MVYISQIFYNLEVFFTKKDLRIVFFRQFYAIHVLLDFFFQEILQKVGGIAKMLRYRNEFDTHLAEQPYK